MSIRVIMNFKLGGKSNEVFMAYFNILHRHMPKGDKVQWKASNQDT